MKMKKKIELPLAEPLYNTYHNQGYGTAPPVENPSIPKKLLFLKTMEQNILELLIEKANKMKGETTK